MDTNDTNSANKTKLIYPKLSYDVTGLCFAVHNELGPYAKEKQYGDLLEIKLKERNMVYEREYRIADTGNQVDFLIQNLIILELKAKRLLTKEDYFQTQRYLQESRIKLAFLVNFRNKYIKPVRIVRIEHIGKEHALQH